MFRHFCAKMVYCNTPGKYIVLYLATREATRYNIHVCQKSLLVCTKSHVPAYILCKSLREMRFTNFYLASCASYHLSHNRNFVKYKPKPTSIIFTIYNSQWRRRKALRASKALYLIKKRC